MRTFLGFQEAISVSRLGFGDGYSGSLKLRAGAAALLSSEGYDLCGGVGDRRLNFCFWLRRRFFRDRIEPAQFRTFFCFLIGFLDKELDRRLLGDSVERNGVSAEGRFLRAVSGKVGLLSLDTDPELVGRDFGEHSPDEVVSWPKKVHFFADLGVDGADDGLAAAASMSSGIELRLLGPSGVDAVE